MKKLFFILLLASSSCTIIRNVQETDLSARKGLGRDRFYLVELNGCEYAVFSGHKKGNMEHAGNCKNHK